MTPDEIISPDELHAVMEIAAMPSAPDTAGEMERIRREVENGTASDDVVFLHGILVEVAVDRAMDAAIERLKKTGRLPALVMPRRGE